MGIVLNFSQFIGESEDQKKIEKVYDKAGKEVEKLIMSFSGSSSGEMTRLINKFVETYELLKDAQESHEAVKEVLKDKINKSFEEEERFITRIIQTVKYTLTVSKYTREKTEEVTEVNYNEVIKELMEVFPDIKEGLKDIIKKHTEVKTKFKKEISGSIKYSHIDVNEGITELLKGTVSAMKEIFTSLYRSLRRLGGSIDKRFRKIDRLMKKG